jgi:hypothetical protein
MTNEPQSNTKLNERLEAITELLKVLQALPEDVSEVKALVKNLEENNQLCYAILKEQGWLLKKHQARIQTLEARLDD